MYMYGYAYTFVYANTCAWGGLHNICIKHIYKTYLYKNRVSNSYYIACIHCTSVYVHFYINKYISSNGCYTPDVLKLVFPYFFLEIRGVRAESVVEIL